MDDIQESSDSEAGSFRMEPNTPDPLNNACLLNDSDYLCEDPGLSHEFSSTFVPETPRYHFICKYIGLYCLYSACNSQVINSYQWEYERKHLTSLYSPLTRTRKRHSQKDDDKTVVREKGFCLQSHSAILICFVVCLLECSVRIFLDALLHLLNCAENTVSHNVACLTFHFQHYQEIWRNMIFKMAKN